MMFPATKRPGAITTILVLAITGIVISAFISLSIISTSQVVQVSDVEDGDQAFYAAEGGIQQGLFTLSNNPGPQTISNTINNAIVTITITNDISDPLGKRRIVTSEAILNEKKRTLQVVATTNALAANIQYAVMSGPGGIIMEENSEVHGSLYSNGPITGPATRKGYIYGHTWVAGSNLASGITVGTAADPKDLHASNYSNITVFTVPDTSTQPTQSYPFTPQQIAAWKDEADNSLVDGGGNVTIDSNRDLGGKVTGNLVINKGIISLTSPVWVTGNITIKPSNQITIRLPGAGNGSGVILSGDVPDVGNPECDTSGGNIDVGNNATIMGSDSLSSFTLLISTKKDTTNPVIFGGNSSTSVIYFAPCGRIRVNNTAVLNNTTGEVIQLQQKSVVNYNPNLSDFYIPNGPPQPIGVVPGTWQHL